jgi:hypothetical protein
MFCQCPQRAREGSKGIAALIDADLSTDRADECSPSAVSLKNKKEEPVSPFKQSSPSCHTVKLRPHPKWDAFEHANTASGEGSVVRGDLEIAGGMVVGDFNGDERPDLAVTNFYADTVSILINNTSTLANCLETGRFTLHGKVKTTTDKSPLVGVTLTFGGPESCQDTSTTDIKGKYAFPGLADGTYTVTPSQEGCTFTPATRTVTIAGADVKVGFKGTCQAVPLRGMIASPRRGR